MRRAAVYVLVVLHVIASTAGAQDYPKSPPAPLPLTPAPFPPFQEGVLPNGLRILVVESRKQPLVSISLSFPGGNRYDPAGKEGLADMVAGLLTKGAGSRTAEQISEAIEGAGGSLGAGAGPDFLTISATVLTPSLPLAFELVADAVARPTFPASEVELLRTQTLSGLQVALSQPGLIADRAFRHELYGNHPYGASPSPASTKAITRDDLLAFHRNRIRPSGALLVLAGDIDLATATRLATSALKGWTGTPATVAATSAPKLPVTHVSCAMTSRRVRRTESTTVPASHGASDRRSITSTSTASLESVAAACNASGSVDPHTTSVTSRPGRAWLAEPIGTM